MATTDLYMQGFMRSVGSKLSARTDDLLDTVLNSYEVHRNLRNITNLYDMQGGDRIGKKDITSILDVNEAGNLISKGFRMIAQKLSEMCKVVCFRHELLYMYQMHPYKEISRDS